MLTVGTLVEVPALGDNGLLAVSLKETDCAVIISYSGSSHTCEPLNVLRFLEPNHVPVVATTRQTSRARLKRAGCWSISGFPMSPS